MPKAFTAIPLHDKMQGKPEDLNLNIDVALEQFNGRLDTSNMPVESVSSSYLAPLTGLASSTAQRGSEGPTQSYQASSNEGSDVWTPLTTIDIQGTDWSRGWNLLHLQTDCEDSNIRCSVLEGMIIGCATIDWHRGQNSLDYNPEEGPGAVVKAGANWWTEWAVFVNNVMVARSGKIYPRRHTTSLPFSIPVGSQPISIDIRWMTNNDRDVRFTSDVNTPLDIFSYHIWSRNQYR